MKTTITRAQLVEAAQAVKGLVSKDSLSPFSKIRLDASGCLSVTGSNGDVQVEWRMDAEIKDQGTVTVPGAAFASFVGAMPEGVVEIECAGRGPRVRMEGGGVKFTLAAGEAADFPVMAGPGKDGAAPRTLRISAAVMREMLRKVKFAVSTDATRKNLEGVNIDLKDGTLGMTATDGRRLAHVEKEIAPDGAGESGRCNITLPTKTVAILYGLLERMDEGDVDVLFDGSAVRIVGDKWALTAKVLADKYPNWRQVVPEKPQHKAELKRGAFLEAMGRAALASDESSGVKITLKNTSAAFEAKNDITAASASMAACKMDEGVKGEFRVNPRLMKDALEAIDEDDFTLHFDDAGKKPIRLTCSLPWVAVVMPLQKMGKEG